MRTDEVWKPIKGYEGLYSVSNFGRIYSIRSKRILKPRKLSCGYVRVNLPSNENKRDAYIHRIVAEAFCDHPIGFDVVNHIDNDKSNNKASNLEWTTQRGNIIHAMDQGRVKRFPNAQKVTATKDGKTFTFRSMNEAAQFANKDSKTIWYYCKTGRKTKNGFVWKKVS